MKEKLEAKNLEPIKAEIQTLATKEELQEFSQLTVARLFGFVN